MKLKDISVIIPAYNEQDRIGKAVNTIASYFRKKGLNYEIIIVDDGSRDLTPSIVKKMALKNSAIKLITNKINKGKGYSVKKGMLKSSGKVCLFTDADISTPIRELGKLLAFTEKGYEVVVGSRRLKNSKIKVYQPVFRRLFGWLFHVVRRIFILSDIKDTQCGFKLFSRKIIKSVFSRQTTSGFVFDAEVLLIARSLGYKIKELPVIWIDDIKSTLSIKKHIVNICKDLIAIKINQVKGMYK